MARSKGPRHVIELPLTVDQRTRHCLERRFAAANTLRNGILQEALRALDACRADPAWAAARLLPRKTKAERIARSEMFSIVRENHGLTEVSLNILERQMRNYCWINDHISARLGRAIIKDVLRSIDGHLFLKRGRPRFRKADDCRTISAEHMSPMRLKGSVADGYMLRWSGLNLPVRGTQFSTAEEHGLGGELVHCRVKRIPNGKTQPASPWRYVVQVVVKGKPLVHRERASSGVVGIDTGPSLIGVVWRDGPAGSGYSLVPLAIEVEPDEAAIRRSERSQDRQRRAANPDCFDDRGRWIKGKHLRHQSKRNAREMASRRKREAKAALHRRNSHGRDTNRILSVANEIRLEDHGFRGWMALWGRAIGRGMPGGFVSELKRKCLDAGGSVVMINTRRAALSQVDALGGERLKKPLRQRWHELGDGSGFVQRDLHSALLASHCNAAGVIDPIGIRADLEGPCQDLVRPTAASAAAMAEAARTRAKPASRSKDRQSGSNASPEVPAMRELSRTVRRRNWLRGRIATRQTRSGLLPIAGVQLASVSDSVPLDWGGRNTDQDDADNRTASRSAMTARRVLSAAPFHDTAKRSAAVEGTGLSPTVRFQTRVGAVL